MATPPPPTKPPRGVKYGKDEPGCGFLVNVIKALGFSETTEERQKEKQKIEKEFKKSDLRLNELVSKHDTDLTRVLPLFSQVSTQITTSREKIHSVKENLVACKELLQCRRDELKKLWTDAVQHKYVLEMLEEINNLRKVPLQVSSHINDRQYLHATKVLTDAMIVSNVTLKDIEGLSDLRSDLELRKTQLYDKLHEELTRQLYQSSTNDVLAKFERSNSSRKGSHFQRNFLRRSADREEANNKVRKEYKIISSKADLENTDAIENIDLADLELRHDYFFLVIAKSFVMLRKVPESIEQIKMRIQSELLEIVENTTKKLINDNLIPSDKHPLLCLLEVIFGQFTAISKAHSHFSTLYCKEMQKRNINVVPYDSKDFWQQAQQVIQLLLKDYLDIENATADEVDQAAFNESSVNINSYFSRRKVQRKRNLFKFDKSTQIANQTTQSGSFKEHKRNVSDMSDDDKLLSSMGATEKKREKLLVCVPDQSLITKIYLHLLPFVKIIEDFMDCEGQPSSLREFLTNFIKDTFLSKGHNRNLQLAIESLSKNQDAWRSIITREEMKAMNLSRPLLQSTVMVEKRISETKSLIQNLPNYSDELLKMVCSLLKTYRETCQAAYRGIVQPDSEDKRIYSVAWLKDEDISRFLKTLPNWTDLQNFSNRAKTGRKLQRSTFEPSEEESPTQVQQRNIREADMLTSNLGEGGISQQEILSDISILKELAILQESMEWFSSRISQFANDLRRIFSYEYSNGVTIPDGTIKVLTNLALEFDELANTCLLVLHLEVRVQCFHYLRTKPITRTNSYLDNKDDILEPDTQVLKLTKVLSEMDEAFSATLHPRKTMYIFEGLAHLASRILIQASNYLENIDQANIQRMCRNSIALQQTLSSITASREVALDQAKLFYELLCMEPDEILISIIEKGSQFTEMQYLNALKLSSTSRGITDANSMTMYRQKLSDILGSKPPPDIVV